MADERKKELGIELLQYSRSFLLQFSERNTRQPPGLPSIKGLIIDEIGAKAPTVPGNSADAPDAADKWRSKAGGAGADGPSATGAPAGTAGPQPRSAAAAVSSTLASVTPAPTVSAEALKIQTAADKGRTKWAPARDLTSTAQAIMKLRGILNKLTPDNFDRLLPQVLGIMSVSAETLHECIPLIFEKAVAEPTFCALYADLCVVLSKELEGVNFGSASGDRRPITFKRELLNTCQDEFEAMDTQRTELVSGPGGIAGADEDARRKLKNRTLGTIRLLAELYNKDLVTQVIMKVVTGSLMERGCANGTYDIDLIECIVSAITISGAKMAESDKLSKPLKAWLGTLTRWAGDPTLEARIRFKIRDLQDLVKAGWESRRETNTVKKTEDIRRQAQAELGMATTSVPDFLPSLPGLALAAPINPVASRDDENILFPGIGVHGMPARGADPGAANDTSAATAESSGPPRGRLPDDEVESKAASAFRELLSARDFRELEACVRELAPSTAQEAAIVGAAMAVAYDAQSAAERDTINAGLVRLADGDCLSAVGVTEGLKAQVSQLEDLSIDVPLSPQILGRASAALAATGKLPFKALEGFLEAVGLGEPKRLYFRHVMAALEADLSRDGAVAMVAESGAHVGPLLGKDAELEPGLPSVFDFVKSEGLDWVPL